MSLLLDNYFIPQEVWHIIAINTNEREWKALCCTCRYTANIMNWPDQRIASKISLLLKNINLGSNAFNLFVSKIEKVERLDSLTRCATGPKQLKEIVLPKLSPQFTSGELHLVVSGLEDGVAAQDIKDEAFIKTLTFQGLRTEVNNKQALTILGNLKKLTTVHINSMQWLRNTSLLPLPSGDGYFPSFPLNHTGVCTTGSCFRNTRKSA